MLSPLVIQSFAEEMVKTADLSPEVIGLLLGGAGGAGLGYKMTGDPRKKTRNAILAGLAGAAGGTVLGGELGEDAPAAVSGRIPGMTSPDMSPVEAAFQKLRMEGKMG